MHIREWPAEERPREKLLARGATALSDAELLALLLGSGLRGRDAVATARELLAHHGPLRALLERPPAALVELPGLGPARACTLAAVIVGHNHPSGNPEPSAADRAVTARLTQALALVDVRLLDHFVIADGPPVSLAGRGWV